MSVNILANIEDQSSGDSTGTFGDVPGLAATGLTVAGTNSVLLIFATLNPLAESDSTANYRLNINGTTSTSPVLTAFADSPTGEETGNVTIAFAVDGLSGSGIDISLEWSTITGTPSRDTSRVASLLILEITGGDALLPAAGDLASSAAFDPTATWSELFGTGDITIAGTGSVVLLLANVPIAGAADAGFECQFSVDDTQEGAITGCYTDAANEMTGWSGVHVVTGLSAGTHTFELMIQDRYGAPILDTTRQRTFQVVEIVAAAAVLKSSIVSAAAHTPTTGWVDDGTLDAPVTVSSTASVMLQIANLNFSTGTDLTMGFRLAMDAVQEGPDTIDFSDTTERAGRTLLAAAKTGMSAASHDFSTQWIRVQASGIADTARERSQFVIEFGGVVYQIDGVTRDKAGDVLGTCEVYCFKDNGDNTLSYIGYDQSDGSGNFSITGISDNDSAYLLYAYKADSPHVFDVSDHVVQPDDGTASEDLYLRSDVDKGETSPDKDLRLRSDTDKLGVTIEFASNIVADSNVTAADLNIKREIALAITAESDLSGGAIQTPTFESHNLVQAAVDQVSHDLVVTNPAGLSNRMLVVACWQEEAAGVGPAITDINMAGNPSLDYGLVDGVDILSTDWLSLEVYRIMEDELPAAGSGDITISVVLASSNVLCITASMIEKVDQAYPIGNNNSQSDTGSTFITTNVNVDAVTDRLMSFCVGSLNNESWNATTRTEHADFLTGQSTGMVSSEVTGIQTPEAVTETSSASHARLCHVVFTVQGSGTGADTQLNVLRELSTAVASASDIAAVDLNVLREIASIISADSDLADIELNVELLINFALDITAVSDLAGIDLIRKIELGFVLGTEEPFSSGGVVLPNWTEILGGGGVVDDAYATSFIGSPDGWGTHCLRAQASSGGYGTIRNLTLGDGTEKPYSYAEFEFYIVNDFTGWIEDDWVRIARFAATDNGLIADFNITHRGADGIVLGIGPNILTGGDWYATDFILETGVVYKVGLEWNAGPETWRWWLQDRWQFGGDIGWATKAINGGQFGIIATTEDSQEVCFDNIRTYNTSPTRVRSDIQGTQTWMEPRLNVKREISTAIAADSNTSGIDIDLTLNMISSIQAVSNFVDIDVNRLIEYNANVFTEEPFDSGGYVLPDWSEIISAGTVIENYATSNIGSPAGWGSYCLQAIATQAGDWAKAKNMELNFGETPSSYTTFEVYFQSDLDDIELGDVLLFAGLLTHLQTNVATFRISDTGSGRQFISYMSKGVSGTPESVIADIYPESGKVYKFAFEWLKNSKKCRWWIDDELIFDGAINATNNVTAMTGGEFGVLFTGVDAPQICIDNIKTYINRPYKATSILAVADVNVLRELYFPERITANSNFSAADLNILRELSFTGLAARIEAHSDLIDIDLNILRELISGISASSDLAGIDLDITAIIAFIMNVVAESDVSVVDFNVLRELGRVTKARESFEADEFDHAGWTIVDDDGTIDGNKSTIGITGAPANWGNECLEAITTVAGLSFIQYWNIPGTDSSIQRTKGTYQFILPDISWMGVGDSFKIGGFTEGNAFIVTISITNSDGTPKFFGNVFSEEFFGSVQVKTDLAAAEDTLYTLEFIWDLDEMRWEGNINDTPLVRFSGEPIIDPGAGADGMTGGRFGILSCTDAAEVFIDNIEIKDARRIRADSNIADIDLDVTALIEFVSNIIAESNIVGIVLSDKRELALSATAESVTSGIDLTRLTELSSAYSADSAIAGIQLAVKRELINQITAESDLAGIQLSVAGLIEFVSNIVAGSATSSIALAIKRELTAAINAGSVTSGIDLDISVLIELVSSIVAESASTCNLKVLRELNSIIPAASSTSSATLNVLRELATSLTAVSTSSDIDLALLVELTTAIEAESNTSGLTLKITRELLNVITATSTVSDVDVNVLRELITSIVGASLTSDIDLLISGFVEFILNIQADSNLSDIDLSIKREFLTAIISASATSGIDLDIGILLEFVSNIVATSATSDIDLNVLRELKNTIVAATLTSDIELFVSGFIAFATNIVAESVTSDVILDIFRELTSSFVVASDVSGIDLSVLREIALDILAGSNVSNVDLQNLLGLVSSITASSNISDADLKVLREFISAVQATSDAQGVNLNVLRELTATFSAASLVSSIDLIVGLFLEFISTVAANSDISDINLDAGRSLILQAIASSDVSTASLSIARALAAVISATSNLTDAQMVVLREIASNIQADSDVVTIDLILGQLRELAGQWVAESDLADVDLLISLIGQIINTQWVSLSTERKIIPLSTRRKVKSISTEREIKFLRRQQ